MAPIGLLQMRGREGVKGILNKALTSSANREGGSEVCVREREKERERKEGGGRGEGREGGKDSEQGRKAGRKVRKEETREGAHKIIGHQRWPLPQCPRTHNQHH
jgi:hypothetical protein